MKIALLTTETTHHAYYASQLSTRFALQGMVVESHPPQPAFDTSHPFEVARDAYERETLLGGRQVRLQDVAPTLEVESVNQDAAVAQLVRWRPDVLLVFGAGKVRPAVMHAAAWCLNLHGGNPERYRGLDSHLWAIYHEDFDQLMTTLHVVDEGLDTGDIVGQTRLQLPKGCRLHQLRAINTQACLDLSLAALAQLQSDGAVPRRRQQQRGAYYSFMPSAEKEACVRKFADYTDRL